MTDLTRAAARAAEKLADLARREDAVRRLLARAADASVPAEERRADLRLLGALAGEAFVGPRIVHLDLVGTCTSNCVYCRDHSPYVRDREPWRTMEMPYELVARLIDEAEELDAELIPLVGAGENLLHTRFADIIALLKRRPLAFEIYTNGLGWTDETIAQFVDATRAKITFSLSAADAKTWAAFRPEMSPALFECIEQTIARIVRRRRRGLRVGVVHVLNKRNARDVLPMIRRAIELGVDEVQYKLTEMNEAAQPLRLDAAEIASIALEVKEARRLAALAGVDIHDNIEAQLARVDPATGLYTPGLYDQIPCFAGFEMVRVRRDGGLSFCCGLKFFANAADTPLAAHWFSDGMQAARQAAVAMPRGANYRLPDGSALRDEQCDYCYNYILNDAYARHARAAGVWHLFVESR
jgi:molybdenum cofactor biosynthesis enzyme MoaA